MSGFSHTTDQKPFHDSKSKWLPFPGVWPFKQKKVEQGETAFQIISEDQPLPPSRRLVIIVPDANIDMLSLPRRIWNLAAPDSRSVLLLIQPSQEEGEFPARMNITTLAATIRDPRVTVQTQLVLGQSLAQAARQCAEPGDVFVCFEEHQVKGFLKRRRLAEILALATRQPVYTLKGTIAELDSPISARLADILLLTLCLVSLIAFFTVEVWIDRNSAGASQGILQILVVIAEVWVIGKISSKWFRI